MTQTIPEQLLRGLLIRQPHSEMILMGQKTEKYRSKRTHIRGRLFLYAGKKLELDVDGITDDKSELLPRSAIVGSIDIIGCRESRKYPGHFEWQLADPIRYPKPLRPRGVPQPGFWRPKF